MLGIIGHNFDGGRHTNSNFGSYWPSDFWDLWQKIQRRTPSDNDITCGLLGRWANNWPKYHKEIDKGNFLIIVIFILYYTECATLHNIFNSDYMSRRAMKYILPGKHYRLIYLYALEFCLFKILTSYTVYTILLDVS